jgi:TetR/AcrR family transcriptional regulator, cholesterol catabolism regulator
MPRNNMHLPQHERIDRVLAVATALFLENGYDATSIADIARGADLRSPAAVIWYFPTKEHILAAALERAATIEEDALKARRLGPTDLFFAYLQDLREMRKLHTTMHERMSKSAVMLESHERLHAKMNARLVNLLADHELKYDLDLTMNVVSAVLEGAYVAPSASFTGSEMVRFVLGLLVEAPAGLDLKRPAGTIEARTDGDHDPGDGAEVGVAGAVAESDRDDGR